MALPAAGPGQDARLVFWDQRSHGRSGRSDPAHVSIEQLGATCAAVLAVATGLRAASCWSATRWAA